MNHDESVWISSPFDMKHQKQWFNRGWNHIFECFSLYHKRFDCCFFFLCEEIATVRVTRRVPRWKIWMWKLRWSTVPSAPTRQEHKFVAQRLLKDGSDQHPSCNWHRCSWLVGRAKWHLYRTNLLKPGVAWKKWPKQATVVAMTPAAEDCPTGEDVWSDYWESCALDRGPFSISKHHQSFPEIICMWLNGSTFTKQNIPKALSISPGRWNERRCLPVSRGGLLATWTQMSMVKQLVVVYFQHVWEDVKDWNLVLWYCSFLSWNQQALGMLRQCSGDLGFYHGFLGRDPLGSCRLWDFFSGNVQGPRHLRQGKAWWRNPQRLQRTARDMKGSFFQYLEPILRIHDWR